MREVEWCRFCRESRPFGVLEGTGPDNPDFRLCCFCGSGYAVDRPLGEAS